MHFWVPIATAAIAGAVAILVDILTGRRKGAKSRREAAATFHLAFAEAIAQLENVDAHALITEARAQHDAAILEFRRFVVAKQIEHYEVAVQNFNRCRSEVQSAPVKVLASLASEKPIDNSDTVKLKEALNELLTFTDKS